MRLFSGIFFHASLSSPSSSATLNPSCEYFFCSKKFSTYISVQRRITNGSHATQAKGGTAESTAPGDAQELSRSKHGDEFRYSSGDNSYERGAWIGSIGVGIAELNTR